MEDSIQNKLINTSVSQSKTKLSYKHETSKISFYTNYRKGKSLEYNIFKIIYSGKVLSNFYVDKIDIWLLSR